MKKRITHVPNHSFIIILNYQNQFIRILIYQTQSEKKKKENTHVSLVTYQIGYKFAYFQNQADWYPSLVNSGTV